MDVIRFNGINYKIIEEINKGGQGLIYRIKRSTDSKIYVLKTINTEKNYLNNQMLSSIKMITDVNLNLGLNKDLDKMEFVFPQAYFVKNNQIHYLMSYAEGTTLDKVLSKNISFKQKLEIMYKISNLVDVLHCNGFFYNDISLNNVIFDSKTQKLYLIDLENISNKPNNSILGTGFFIAPEVAFSGKKENNFQADLFALAVLNFKIITDNIFASPYHGKAILTNPPLPESTFDIADWSREGIINQAWRYFMFDPKNSSNNLESLNSNIVEQNKVEKVKKIWESLDDRLKNLFYKSFLNPFEKNRPSAKEWKETISKIIGLKKDVNESHKDSSVDNNEISISKNSNSIYIKGSYFNVNLENIAVIYSQDNSYYLKNCTGYILYVYQNDVKIKELYKDESFLITDKISIQLSTRTKKINIKKAC